MKKAKIPLLIVITSAFIVVLTGIFCFRNFRTAPVTVTSASHETEATSTMQNSLLNINTATHAQLSALPGIGETLAGRIVTYRNNHGSFQSVEQLLNVDGIGTGKLNTILDMITTGGNELP